MELILEYDNSLEISDNVDYKVLGEEKILEKNISIEYQALRQLVTDLKSGLFSCGFYHNTTELVYKEGALSVTYTVIHLQKKDIPEKANAIKKAQKYFENYLNKFDNANCNDNPFYLGEDNISQMIKISSIGTPIFFEDIEKIFSYLEKMNISYAVYQVESSSVEMGASTGFSDILLLIKDAVKTVKIIADIKEIFGGEKSHIDGQEIDNHLEKRAKKIIAGRYNIHFDQVYFVEQTNHSNNNRQFIFKTRTKNQFYEVIFDENNELVSVKIDPER